MFSMPQPRIAVGIVLLVACHITAQQYVVVPAAHATTDAPSYCWLAGASQPLRQQTLVGGSHLTALQGQTLTALELRRNATGEAYAGGSAQLTVTLSISPRLPLEVSTTYAANAGANAVTVFSGTVAIPASPAVVGSTVAWTANNTIRIPFTTPFPYSGGTLCVDITGAPVGGQPANWWMVDAALDDLRGTKLELGGGCGQYGGVASQWSSVSRRSLVAGAYARFSASGTLGGFALAAIGQKSPVGVPLAALGFPSAPSCELRLQTLDALMLTWFQPPAIAADQSFGGDAEVVIKLPSTTGALGLTFTTQWLDWSQMATSNAIEWTTAPSIPTLDMAQVDGHPGATSGLAGVYLAHVLRFEAQ